MIKHQVFALFCLYLFATVNIHGDGIIGPLSTNTINYEFNGNPTTMTIATVLLTETSGTSTLLIDSSEVTARLDQYSYNFKANKVGRIPASILTYVQESCLTNDVASFVKSRLAADNTTVAGEDLVPPIVAHAQSQLHAHATLMSKKHVYKTDVSMSNLGTHANINRKLLFYGAVLGAAALGVSYVALTIATRAEATANHALEKVNALGSIVEEQGLALDAMKSRSDNQQAQLDKTAQILGGVASTLEIQQAAINKNAELSGANALGLEYLKNGTRDQLLEERRKSQAADEATQASISGLEEGIKTSFAMVYERMESQFTFLSSQTQLNRDSIYKSNDKLLTTNSILQDYMKKTQPRNMATKGLHEFIASLDEYEGLIKPWVTDPGTPPNATVEGPYARILQETISYNFVNKEVVDDDQRVIVRVDYNVYADTRMSVLNIKNYADYESLVKLYGPAVCKRSYGVTIADITYPDSIDEVATQACGIWVEEIRTSCIAKSDLFEWKTANASISIHDQSPDVKESLYCVDDSLTTTGAVIRTVQQFHDRNVNLCLEPLDTSTTGGAYFMVTTTNTDGITFTPGPMIPAHCSLDIFTTTLDYSIPPRMTPSLIELGYVASLKHVYDAQMRFSGRIPGGIEMYEDPFVYTPTRREPCGFETDGVTVKTCVVYDGSAEAETCHYATMLAVSKDVLDVWYLTPRPDQLTTVRVVVETIQRVDPSAADYDVPKESLALFSQFQSDSAHTIPKSMIIVGDLPTRNAGVGIAYDIPPELLTVSGGYIARKNKVTCALFDKDLEEVPDLTTFKETIGTGTYKPSECGLSAQIFAVRRVEDWQGYPLCDTQGGLPAESLITGQYNVINKPTCNGGFTWIDDNSIPYNCTTRPDTGAIVAVNGTIVSSPTFDFASGNWAISFVYWTTSAVTRIFSYHLNGQFLVIDSGLDLVIRSGSTPQLLSLPVWHNDGEDSHTVFIRCTGTTLTIVIDGLTVKTQTSWGPSSGTPSSTTGVPAGVTVFGAATPGAGANVNSLTYYHHQTDLNDAVIVDYSFCQFAHYSSFSKCAPALDVTKSNSDSVYGTDEPLSVVYEVKPQSCYPNDGGVFLPDVTVENRVSFGGPSRPTWTLTFWLDYIGTVADSTTIVDFKEVGGWKVNIANSVSNTYITLYNHESGSGTPVVISSPTILAGDRSHFVALVFSGSDTLTIYIDQVIVLTRTDISFGSMTFASMIEFHPRATMARLYNGYPMPSGGAMGQAMTCDMPPTNDAVIPEFYRTPLASCVSDPILSTKGYCRHPTMCNGHCSAWSTTINKATRTFTTASYQCDAGYKGANCDTVCTRKDSLGYCLPDIDILAGFNNTGNGAIPGGDVCNTMRHNRMDSQPWPFAPEDVNQALVTISPRQVDVVTTIKILSGKIVSSLGSSTCPKVVDGSQSSDVLQYLMENTGSATMRLKVMIRTPEQSDCWVEDKLFTIQPQGFAGFTTPVCENMTVSIDGMSGMDTFGEPIYGLPCSTYSGVSITNAIANPIDVTPVVRTLVVTAVDEASMRLNQNSFDLIRVMIDLQKVSAIAAGASQTELRLLDAYAALTANATTYQTVNFTQFYSGDIDIGGQALTDLINRVKTEAAAIPSRYNTTSLINNITAGLQELKVMSALDANYSMEIGRILDDIQIKMWAFNNMTAPDGSGWDGLEELAKIGGGALARIPSFISSITDSIFGAASSPFKSLVEGIMNLLMQVAIIGAIVFGIYLLVTKGVPALMAKKNDPTTKRVDHHDDDDDEERELVKGRGYSKRSHHHHRFRG